VPPFQQRVIETYDLAVSPVSTAGISRQNGTKKTTKKFNWLYSQ